MPLPYFDGERANCIIGNLVFVLEEYQKANRLHHDGDMHLWDIGSVALAEARGEILPSSDCPWCSGPTTTAISKICPRHAAELKAEIEVMP